MSGDEHRPLLNNDCALQRGVGVSIVVVKAARADRRQIASLACLTGLEEPNLIDGGAVRVFGMGIRGHVVDARVVVHERHA